jgi:adenylate cyclase
MIRQSIKRQIVSIAVGLIVLMVITAALSMLMAGRVGHLLDELTTKYIPAYAHLARADIRSVERALALRQMVIAKMQEPPDEAGYAAHVSVFEAKGREVEQGAHAARELILSIIADTSTLYDAVALVRIESHLEAALNDTRRHLNEEISRLIPLLEARNFVEIQRELVRVDAMRDDLDQKFDVIRKDMLAQVYSGAGTVVRDQQRTIWISAIVTALAAILGLIVAMLVSGGITRPVRRLLEGTREVEAGHLDGSIEVTSHDEIGQLSSAFNRMVAQLRQNAQIRETFGKYIDPKVVEGLIDRPALAAAEGQRRVMTVMFCDMKGFTSFSEGVTPQGLVKVMNRYLSTMSEPIRSHRGIIDKYIGDAIMAYWGPPFVEEENETHLACLAAIEMTARLDNLRKELPELLGLRSMPMVCDMRIGIATGEALVGSIGSEVMMSYTVIGDTVNFASRLEGANKIYGTRCLVSENTIATAGPTIESREVDRIVVAGQSIPNAVFEIMGRTGELTGAQTLLRTKYSEALAAYRQRRWEDAGRALGAALEAVPSDGPSLTLTARIKTFQASPPPDNWNGTWRLDNK